MEPSEVKISISVYSYDEKTAEDYRNFYVAEKRIFINYERYLPQILIAQIEDLNVVCVKISRLQLFLLQYFIF